MTHSSDHKEKLFLSQAAGRHFTLILNDALTDSRLSWRAKGILAGCLSLANTKFSKQWILDHGTEGRDAVIAALKELRQFGYLQNKIDRCDRTGRVLGEYYLVSDVTIGADQWHRRPGNPDAGFPDAGNPDAGTSKRPIHANASVRDRDLGKSLTGGVNYPRAVPVRETQVQTGNSQRRQNTLPMQALSSCLFQVLPPNRMGMVSGRSLRKPLGRGIYFQHGRSQNRLRNTKRK